MQISKSADKNMKIDETGNTAHLCDSESRQERWLPRVSSASNALCWASGDYVKHTGLSFIKLISNVWYKKQDLNMCKAVEVSSW